LDALLQARESVADHVTLIQAPIKPWKTDDEAAEYAANPKAYLLKKCAAFVDNVDMATNHVMVATFFLPEFTNLRGPDGTTIPFFVSDKTTDEATWQGRVGLLIAKGPMCWQDDEHVKFGGTSYEIGEWVCFDRQDGRQTSINRVHCRKLKDVDIWGRTRDPWSVY
jgi:hypothetical protein